MVKQCLSYFHETFNINVTFHTPSFDVIVRLIVLGVVIVTDEEMEAERQSLYKAIGYAKGKALEPFAKEVCNF